MQQAMHYLCVLGGLCVRPKDVSFREPPQIKRTGLTAAGLGNLGNPPNYAKLRCDFIVRIDGAA
jgi:hypothetical protein